MENFVRHAPMKQWFDDCDTEPYPIPLGSRFRLLIFQHVYLSMVTLVISGMTGERRDAGARRIRRKSVHDRRVDRRRREGKGFVLTTSIASRPPRAAVPPRPEGPRGRRSPTSREDQPIGGL
jgi:hypothetical protein